MPGEEEEKNITKLIVEKELVKIDSCKFYKLSVVESETKEEHYLLPVSNFVLYPGLILDLTNKDLIPYGTILEDEKIGNGIFASNIYHYIDGEFKINFPEIVNKLNSDLSGIVQEIYSKDEFKKKFNSDLKLDIYEYDSMTVFCKIKLDKQVIIDNKKIFNHIYVPYNTRNINEKDKILKGFKLTNLKIDSVSIFDSDILIAREAKKFNDVISGEDKKFINKNYLYKNIYYKQSAIFLIFSMLVIAIGLGPIIVKSIHPGHILSAIIFVIIYFFKNEKDKEFQKLSFEKKDDLLWIKKIARIKISIFLDVFTAISLFFCFIMAISYNSSYVYDSVNNKIINRTFIIDKNEILNVSKILNRYHEVDDKYKEKVFYQNKNKLLNEDKILAIDLEVKFTEGLHLVKISDNVVSAKMKLQKEIELGKFGDWNKNDIINDVDFQKSLIDIREVFKSYILEDYYKNNSSEEKKNIIEYVEVKPRYTRLY